MMRHEWAPAKVNLVLQVGPPDAGGMHPLCSLFASLDLADELTFEEAAADEVVCADVEGENLAAVALAAFRAAAPAAQLPSLRVSIVKHIPVAAGLGGGSSDAAAVLRAANALAGDPLGEPELASVAVTLGSDVPSLLRPAHALVTGTGEVVEPLGLPEMALVLVPQSRGLLTADVYAELDRLRDIGAVPVRATLDPEQLRQLAGAPAEQLAAGLENDLEHAALSLRPGLSGVLGALRETAPLGARITGSGPTAFGVYPDRPAAEAAAERIPGALVAQARA